MQTATLTPCLSALKEKGSPITPVLEQTLQAMQETVTILKLSPATGNAYVRDSKGRTFYCNAQDLTNLASP